MKRRLLCATALAVTAATAITTTALLSATSVILTPLSVYTTNNHIIGIDWLPSTDELLVSTNWSTGTPFNFFSTDRATGAPTQWGTTAGWSDEIYFASVRPGQGDTWSVGDVFSAEGQGTPNTTQIARFNPDGTLVRADFAILPGETKLKRGAVVFDRFGVAGNDLIVVAANDQIGPSTVYRIASTGTEPTAVGVVTALTTIPDKHLEGVTTIPNDVATYGPWAGKILAGAEFSEEIYTIDPVNGATVVYTRADLGLPPTAVPFRVEDLWVIPPDSAFYATDCGSCDPKSPPSRLWTAPASQWTSMVGQVLVAQEYNAQLYVVRWNGSSFTTEVVYNGFDGTANTPSHFEHITFAPNATTGTAKISIAPNATNEVGAPHTFTVTLEKDTGSGFVPAAGEHVDVTLTDSNGAVHGAPTGTCTNAGANTDANGQCTITFTSNTAGTVTGHASSTLTVGQPITVRTDGVSPNSGDATKTFVDANIQVTPDGTNLVGQSHTFTAHVNVNAGSGGGSVNAPDGTLITFTIDGGPGTPNPPNSCTTIGGTGSCTTTITSAVTGVTQVSAHTTLSLGGVSLTRNTDGVGANSGPAHKTWVAAKISIAPNATNGVGQSHTFTVTLEEDTGAGYGPAAGEHVDVTLTDANSAVHTAPTGSCTSAGPNTDANGQCTITFTSNTAGTVTGHATSTLSVNGSAPITVATNGVAPNSGDAVKTFVDANIQITPDGTNRVGATHTFTAHVNVNNGSGSFVNAPNGTSISFTIDSGPGSFTTSNPCTTSGGTGSCTINLTSAVVGVTKVSAHTTLTVGGVSLTRDTNGSGANSGPATKTWVNARVSITPNATNAVGQPHTFTVTLEKDSGTGTLVPAAGEHVDVTLTDANGAVHTAPSGTCTTAGPNTDANGQCTITFSSNSAGTVTGHATSTLSVNGSAPFTISTDGIAPDSGDAVKTFVDANIQITPDGTNQVGATHTFTAHVNVNSASGFVNAPNGTQISFTIDSGPGSFTTSNPCTTSGGTGSCAINLTSTVVGVTKVSAHTTVSVGGVSLTRDTNGTGANSGPATKTWVNARITITPTATNAVGQPHTFTVTLQKDNGTGTFVAASGEHVTVTLTDANGAVHTAPTGSCTATGANTDAAGQCTITFNSNTAGTVTGHATSTLSVNGSAPITVATDGVAPNSGDAVKTYVDANIQISPLTATNPISTTHTLTGHVNVNPGTGFVNAPDGTTITFSIVSGPGSFVGSPTCTTSGATGSCTAVITSAVVGTTTVKAATNVTVAGVLLHRETADGLPGDSVNAQKTWTSPPQLRVVKTPDNGTFTVGSQASFTIVVSNPAPTGSQSATSVMLTDTLPTNGGLTWTSVTTTQGSCSITGGNALSCSLGTIAPQGSVTIVVKSVTTTLPMCTSQPNPAAIATAAGGLTAQDSGSLSCTSGFVSYTPGGWGAPPNGSNVATKLYTYFGTMYGNNGFVIGGNGGRYTGTWRNRYVNGYLTITNWMPDGGTGGKFIQNYTDAVTTSAGILATQTAALKLNIDFSTAGIINQGLSSFANLKLTNKQPYLNGYTVAQVLGIANTAIGGGTLPSGITYGILSTLLGQINGNFDPTNGTGYNAGYLKY